MADMVIITEIEYVTVSPSQANPTPTQSQIVSQPTSVVSKTSLPSKSATIMSTPPESSVALPTTSTSPGFSMAHPSTSKSPESSMAHPSTTGLPPLPSGWPAPAKSTEKKPWDDSLAKLTLAGIVVMAVILLSMIGYAIFQRFRGKCHKCDMNEEKLRKWDSGELKRITKDMVKARATLNAQASGSTAAPASSDFDLEKGAVVDFEADRNAHRAIALAALNRPRSVVQKPSLFERAKGALKQKKKDKHPPPAPSPAPPRRSRYPSYDRFFAVTPVTKPAETLQPTRYQSPYVEDGNDSNERLDHAYDPPTPKQPSPPDSPTSIYSYDGGSDDKFTVRPLPELPPVRSLSPNASVVSSALHIHDPRHRARYADAQRKMEEGTASDEELQKAVKDVNVVEAQMRGRRRSRTYGGLPHPES